MLPNPTSARAQDRPTASPVPERSWYVAEGDLLRLHRSGRLEARLQEALGEEGPARIDLFLENTCDQSCEFCNHPAERSPPTERLRRLLVTLDERVRGDLVASGAFSHLLAFASHRAVPATVTVTGNDWATHPARDRILGAFEQERRARVRFHGPSTALADPALAERVARLPTLDAVHLSLFSSDPGRHDAVTGTPGSGARVLAAIDQLVARGVPLKLFAVLTARVVEGLPSLLAYVKSRGLRIGLLAFLPDARADGWSGAGLFASAADLHRALSSTPPEALGAITTLDGLPFCAVPAALHEKVRPGGRGHQREPSVHPAPCTACAFRTRCDGLPASLATQAGAAGLRTLGTDGQPLDKTGGRA